MPRMDMCGLQFRSPVPGEVSLKVGAGDQDAGADPVVGQRANADLAADRLRRDSEPGGGGGNGKQGGRLGGVRDAGLVRHWAVLRLGLRSLRVGGVVRNGVLGHGENLARRDPTE